MNKRICTVILGTMFAVSGLIFAQSGTNLLKNSDLKFDDNGKLIDWSHGGVKCKFSSDAGYKGQNSARGTLGKQEAKPGEEMGKAVMLQRVEGLKPGKYTFSAYIKLDRKINNMVLLRIIKVDGKDLYQGTHLKAPDQPEPGAWAKVMAEFDIPAGTDVATIAFDLRDSSDGANVWVDSPALTYKAEQ